MKIDLETFKARLNAPPGTPVIIGDPRFGTQAAPLSDREKRQLWRPVYIGSLVIAVFVVGLFIYAAFAQINGAVIAPGIVRVESNRQTIRHQDGGIVRRIFVTDGQRVKAGQLLIQFDDLQPRAQVDVLRNQEDSLLAQYARFEAEAGKRSTIQFPQDLLSRQSDPRVASLIMTQTNLFNARRMFIDGQAGILGQRMEQLDTRIEGLRTQIQSIDEQVALTDEELAGYRKLNEQGYAPKNLLLRYERNLSDLRGRRGSLISDVTRTQEQKGETRMQLTTVQQERQTEASEGLRDTQTRLADVSPRLSAAEEILQRTSVRSPADGYVLNLSQFTIGGVAGSGEVLMDIVPANRPLVVTAKVKPEDIDSVSPGMEANLRLTAYASRRLPPLQAQVLNVSADRLVDQKTGEGYFTADVKVEPAEVAKLGRGVKVTPGMPVEVSLITGKRSILSYLVGPISDTFGSALREP